MVGTETLPSRMSGLPAIRLSFGVVVSTSAGALEAFAEPGAPFGQIGICVCPAAGCHACACNTPAALHSSPATTAIPRIRIKQLPMIDRFNVVAIVQHSWDAPCARPRAADRAAQQLHLNFAHAR